MRQLVWPLTIRARADLAAPVCTLHRGEAVDFKFGDPEPLLSVDVIGPEAMFNGAVAGSDANSDQVVEIAIWKTFDIQIDRYSAPRCSLS